MLLLLSFFGLGFCTGILVFNSLDDENRHEYFYSKVNECFINVLFNIIKLYTYLEIYLMKTKFFIQSTQTFKMLQEKYINYCKVCKDDVFFIHDNEIMTHCKVELVGWNPMMDYDFILYSDYCIEEKKTNHIIYYSIPTSFSYEECDFTFLSVELETNNNKYPIQLSSSEFNYYIVNNIINSTIIRYLLNQQHNIALNKENYKLNIIDNNIQFLNLTIEDKILLLKNGYKIINENDIDYDDMKEEKSTDMIKKGEQEKGEQEGEQEYEVIG